MWVNLLFSLPVVSNGLFPILYLFGFPPGGRSHPPNPQHAAVFLTVSDEILWVSWFLSKVRISSLRGIAVEGTQSQALS